MADLTHTLEAPASRRSEIRKDANYVHVMKYMGSKRELLPDIRQAVESLIAPGGTVLDLFAGSCSVGTYLRRDYTIRSNDIQKYSQVLANALIGSSRVEIEKDSGRALRRLRILYESNLAGLKELFPTITATSDAYVSLGRETWTDELRSNYLRFAEEFPGPLNGFQTRSEELRRLRERFDARSTEPYCQTSFLFPETYFSFSQCQAIDSTRFAIDHAFGARPFEKAIALAALMHAHSYCSSGTGHFAMFRDIGDVTSVRDVFIYRKRDVWSYFAKKFTELTAFHVHDPSKPHTSHCLPFDQALNDAAALREVDVIYADPPYSFVHYSRFYHATESLVRYDYMLPRHKGRYRTDRHQSPFCQARNAPKAFGDLFGLASRHGKHVVLSYSDTGMIPLSLLRELIERQGFGFELLKLPYHHSTMGRKGHKTNLIQEYIVIARNGRATGTRGAS